jgi:hypothetical protein
MNFLPTAIEKISTRKILVLDCVWLFSVCLLVYLANGQTISSDDSIPNTLLALNWLENHVLHFDAFRQGHYYLFNDVFGKDGIPYYFVEAPNGHLTSAYPIGTAIVTFPVYLGLFVALKLTALLQGGLANLALHTMPLTSESFEAQREVFEKLVAAIIAAFTTILFYLAVQLKFGRSIAFIVTFIYAFATLNWAISSQGLWQHTASNLVLTSAILALLKANRTHGNKQKALLIVAGIFCGLLPGIRPTSAAFSGAMLAYSILTYRKQAIFFVLGNASVLLNVLWNMYFFGGKVEDSVVGGYSALFQNNSSSYEFTFDAFKEAFLGLLVSPSRGLFVFSPILLFSFPGIYQALRKGRSHPDERLLILLTLACFVIFIHYCFYPWWGAVTYGSRYLVDTLPVLCYLIAYFVADILTRIWAKRKRFAIGLLTFFFISLTFSTFTQVVGAFSDPHVWDESPYFSTSRLWSWQDSQIERHAKNLWLKLDNPIAKPKAYRRKLNGVIEQIKYDDGQPITDVITAHPLDYVRLEANVRNTGQSQWYGYDTGLLKGRVLVKTRFYDDTDREIKMDKLNVLYVEGTPKTGEMTTAIGAIQFPQEPGRYKMVFSFRAERVGKFRGAAGEAAYQLAAEVKAP